MIVDAKLEKRLRLLRRALVALGRLGDDCGRVARRNARRRVLGALRALRAVVDAEWPAIVDRTGAQRLTPEGRMRRWKAAGWEPIGDESAASFAAVGVSVRKAVTTINPDTVYQQTVVHFFVPKWAVVIGADKPARLRAAKRSVIERRAVLAAAALAK